MKQFILTCLLLTAAGTLTAQDKKKPAAPAPAAQAPASPPAPPKKGPQLYKEVITNKARTDSGLFWVHKVEDKYYFEIADSLLGRDILVVNRISKAAAGMRNFFFGYAGDQIGSNVIRFEKGPHNKLFLKKVSFDEISKDSTQAMYKAVNNSNVLPIVAAFDIKVLPTDSTATVIDFTDYISGDNDVLFFSGNAKSTFQVGAYQSDKSYITDVKSYPLNIEIKTVKTYSKGGGAGSLAAARPPATAGSTQSVMYTLELNSSMVLLPETPARQRFFDPRVGYFARRYTDFDANPQGVKDISIIVRWKLEPREEDVEKYKRGDLVEPKKQIVYYIDPATPKKWVPYLIQGVNDWQPAFEKAGFKNAIVAKPAPAPWEDSTWSLEDARYSAIVYKPSVVANASGPNVHDPRSGEILESHINWYHNVMNLLRDWYFIQCSPTDPRARKMEFDDELMGQLIRFVSSHEVGHTLGLRHNFGSSSSTPVEKLRDKAWVEANGHTPSIMDYARFNYVAQPEDSISQKGLFPRIGDYDKWAIEWGYRWFPGAATPEEEIPVLNKLTIDKLKDKRFWFGTESNADDPHSQNEDLGDNAMKAGAYAIKNLQRIVPNLMEWTREPNADYENLSALYNQLTTQYGRYMGHAAKNIGGIYETPKTVEQQGPVYAYTPKAIQKEAMAFLIKQLFVTPQWLINNDILNRIGNTGISVVSSRQEAVLNRIISTNTISKLLSMEAELHNDAYKAADMLDELKQGIWTELSARKPIDIYRRNLQKSYVERIGQIISPASVSPLGGISFRIGAPAAMTDTRKSDIISVLKGNLRALQAEIKAALPATGDRMTKYHLQDVNDRIGKILDPGK
ncbi:zinc-dependent metalloprotease [Agriterribacter sp.]|uniref:zinc-dependent metalloprotease n=2 Tax=Agriterribacter sp. TaxID=2821509 RepID=UPI002C96F158|nr:zinc-dependent metalloprotease [Agriterribacter sp.]HRO47854.1 zinc-dependent metalloprotease [Agriterribacter sp.]